MRPEARTLLREGMVIPACPLALNARRELDERRQRALCRYYAAAGAGGLAVGVHTTQFAIRNPSAGLFRPVLELALEEWKAAEVRTGRTLVRIGGICGAAEQALGEAGLLNGLGYDAGLLSLGAMRQASEDELIAHCARVAECLPIIGFYLQPSVGGRPLPYSFWRRFVEIPNVVAIKIAPFNRYQTVDVVRAVAESGREEIALYTGNDDNIVADLVTPFRFRAGNGFVERRIVGGLLGQWAVWTRRAVELLGECRKASRTGETAPRDLLRAGVELTDANSAFFDAANGFKGCIPGIHEVLRRQGLLEGTWCLDPDERLGAGQAEEIDRVCKAYPRLADDEFIAAHLEEWLK